MSFRAFSWPSIRGFLHIRHLPPFGMPETFEKMRKLLEVHNQWTLDNTWLTSITRFFECVIGKKIIVTNNVLELPFKIGVGKMYHWDIEEGISAAYWECVFNETIQFYHLPEKDHNNYTFFIDFAHDTNTVTYNGRTTRFGLNGNHTVYCSSSQSDIEYCARRNRPIKALAITVDKNYFEEKPEYHEFLEQGKIIDWRQFDIFAKINKEILMNLVNLRNLIHQGDINMLYLKGKIFYILSLLLDTFIHKKASGKKISLEEIEKLIVLNKAIEKAYYNPLPEIHMVAAELHMSESKFKQIFKEVYNNSYYQYHMDQRLLLSKEFLRQRQIDISQITVQIGYSNSSHFSRAFKNKFGISPMHYHERYMDTFEK